MNAKALLLILTLTLATVVPFSALPAAEATPVATSSPQPNIAFALTGKYKDEAYKIEGTTCLGEAYNGNGLHEESPFSLSLTINAETDKTYKVRYTYNVMTARDPKGKEAQSAGHHYQSGLQGVVIIEADKPTSLMKSANLDVELTIRPGS